MHFSFTSIVKSEIFRGNVQRSEGRPGRVSALLFIVLLVLALLTAGTSAASPAGPMVGINGAACAYADILSAIAAASDGDTIYIAPGTYNGPLGTIDHDLSFVGATTDCTAEDTGNAMWDYVIDGVGVYSPIGGVANIAPGKTVSFTRLMMINGFADNGGNVFVGQDATLNLSEVRLHDGEANFNGGNVYVAAGGSLFSNYNVWFNDGIAGSNGGGLYLEGHADLHDTDIGGNEALLGGGVAMRGDSFLTLSWGDIGNGSNSNIAQEGGGVHMSDQAHLELDCLSRVNANFALAGNGGGIYATGDVIIDMLCNAMVRGNDATAGFGGGIYAQNNASILMRENSLVGTENPAWPNEAIRGGGLYLLGVNLFAMLDEASVQNNDAGDFGGGVYLSDGSAMSMRGGLVAYNQTGVAGGGIAIVLGEVELTEGATIRGNEAMFGGGVAQWANVANRFSATNAHIDGNSASVDGGGLYIQGGMASLFDTTGGSTLSTNSAQGNGGGVYADGPVFLQLRADETASAYRVENNTAGLDGGGFHLVGIDTIIDGKLAVVGNEAVDDGGGLYQDGGYLIMEAYPEDHLDDHRVLFTGNTAVNGRGGGLFLNGVSSSPGDSNSLLFNTLIDDNTANTQGGAMYIDGGSYVHLLDTRVLNNQAAEAAGLRIVDSRVAIKSDGLSCENALMPADTYCSELRGNMATGKGGAIAIGNGTELTVEDTAVIDNSATLGSGLLSASNSDKIDLTNSLVSLNSGKAVVLSGDAQMDVVQVTIAGNDWGLDIDGAGAIVDMQNSIVWNNGFGVESAVVISGGCSISQNGVGGIADDPLFQSTARGDYRLPVNSPAVDACGIGTDHDLDALLRPQGSAYDMGAFEAGPPKLLFALELVVPEGDEGLSAGVLEVTLSEPSSQLVEVTVEAVGLSATEGVDFMPLNEKITFTPGVTSQQVAVQIMGDMLVEGDEELELVFSNPSGADLVATSALVIIVDDDGELGFTLFMPIVIK